MQRRAISMIALLIVLLLSGCTQPPTPGSAAPSGTLRWSLAGVNEIARLDPARLGSNQENIPIYLIFGGLVRLNERLEIVGEGAERWTVSPDGMLYTFTLRPNLRYGDGSAVTAQHFADALARTVAPATGTNFALTFLENVVGVREVAAGTASSLAGVEAPDERTLRIRLDSPRGYFLSQLSYALTYLVPPGQIETAGTAWVGRAFGSGPFRVKAYEPGVRLLLEGNPHYWAGPPGIAEIELKLYPSTDAAFTAYQLGEVDVMGSVQAGAPTERLNEIAVGTGFLTLSAPTVRYLGFNNTLPPFSNLFVRQAFAQAVDKRALVEQVFAGSVVAAERILPEGFPGSQLAIEPLRFDPVGARAALGLAGFVSGGELPPLSLTYDQGDADLARVALVLQRSWRETLGTEVRLEPVSTQELISRLDAMIVNPRDPTTALQIYLSVWTADYPDPQNFISLQLHSQSPFNNGRWTNARFDELISQADALSGDAPGRRERLELYREAEQIAVSEVGWLPLYNPQATLAVRPNVRGLVATAAPQGIIALDWTQVRVDAPSP